MAKVSRPVESAVQLRFEDMAARLRLARKRRGISTVEMAERTGISRDTLHRLERGDSSIGIATLLRVLSILGMERDLDHVGADVPPEIRRQDLIDFAHRDWSAIAEVKTAHWLERKRRFGPGEAFRVADELRRHVAATRPEWPDAAERLEDAASHAALGKRLRRVRSIRSR